MSFSFPELPHILSESISSYQKDKKKEVVMVSALVFIAHGTEEMELSALFLVKTSQ